MGDDLDLPTRVTSCGSIRTSPRRATFRLDGAGSSPAVEFDGDDYVWADKNAQFGTLAGDKTVLFVARVRSADGGYVFDGTTALGRNAVFTGQSGAQHRWHTYTGATPPVGPAVEHDVFQVHSVQMGPGQLEHFMAGTLIYSGSSAVAPWGRSCARGALYPRARVHRRHRRDAGLSASADHRRTPGG